jgi:HAMP domain-containing protein
MTRFQYLVLGYGLIFAVLGIYLFLLNQRIARLTGVLEELRRRLERGDRP